MALFVVSSGYEQKIIHDYFGYDNEEIIITGLARWDVLEDKSDPAHKEILLMPTWRSWLEDISEEQFKKSEYYQRYKAFLQDERLKTLLEKENITLNFYIHPKFREHIRSFQVEDRHIRLIPFGDYAAESASDELSYADHRLFFCFLGCLLSGKTGGILSL